VEGVYIIAIMKSTGRKTIKGTKVSAPLSAKAKATTATTTSSASGPTHEQISKRAYELYLERGSVEGHHDEDWLLAEAELSSSK
jgi:hypothetical protein